MYLNEVEGKGNIYAKCVSASITRDIPIYTLEIQAPKFIDAEFEKHRMLSSNSSSSRAIPFKELDNPFVPFDVRTAGSGMQSYENVNKQTQVDFEREVIWHYKYITSTFLRYAKGVHKQHLNRYQEPWRLQKKIVTATEWSNFFELRLAKDAQPEIQELARCMKEAINSVTPEELSNDQWHLPYITNEEKKGAGYIFKDEYLKMSAARCARVSYLNHDKLEPKIVEDIKLADRLLSSKHMTPFEHQAKPMEFLRDTRWNEFPCINIERGISHMDTEENYWSGNFKGWIQNRKLVE